MNIAKQIFLAVVALVGGMTNANAVLIDLWDYTLNTTFTVANTFTPGGGTIIQNGTQVSWGGSQSVFDIDSGDISVNRSGLTLATTGPDAVDPPPAADMSGTVQTDNLLSVGLGSWISYHNKPISQSYVSLKTSQIASTLMLTPHSPPEPGRQGPVTTAFTIHIADTFNEEPCTAPSPAGNPCNDIIAINAADVLNRSFTFEGIDYFVSTFPITRTGLGNFIPLTDLECQAAGATTGCFGFTTVEGQDTTVQFGFAITSRPVPEPTTLLLACLGFGVLGLMRRRWAKSLMGA